MSRESAARPAIAVSGLEKRYDGAAVLALDRLEVAAGSALAVVGANGAGKTVLLKLLGLLLSADAGRIEILGEEVGARPDEALRRRLTYVAQSPFLFRGSVVSEVGRGLAYRGVALGERRQRARAALREVGLERLAERRTRGLSAGEGLRVALARALVLGPEVLLLDEPTATLDAASAEVLDATLAALRGRTTVVLATHDRAFAERHAGLVLRLERGRRVG